MFCTKCGKELSDGVKFCIYCGEKVIELSSSTATNTEEQQSLRSEWKESGTNLGHAFRDLGHSFGTTKDKVLNNDRKMEDGDPRPVSDEDLKKSWKKAGVALGHGFRDVGKSILRSVDTVSSNVTEKKDGNKEDK